ncbi:helix-turn-helix domain-containing protein [Dyadobacter arcticus]|uniref:DNA-binding XRE family transcriptional regulator n=1 Tax=Dyadobacter arcticus TaxID=1078754 RepID=A0ABX0UXL8_9BACT|nr:helix-turn-helix transcriptional regulator [Dyadobacter arcticus]NIJ55671.1 DNA-binding XRE family transcriptional regulator [Dyadobacter arcticus]
MNYHPSHQKLANQQSIQRLEAGKVNPSFFYLHEIATGLGVTMQDITQVSS